MGCGCGRGLFCFGAGGGITFSVLVFKVVLRLVSEINRPILNPKLENCWIKFCL